MENAITKKNNIFFFEDFSAKELNENKVGRKGLSLFHLKEMDVPVPEFFVVGGHVFTEFCLKAFDTTKQKLLEKGKNPEEEEVLNSLLKQDFSKEVQEDILSAYTRLSGFTDAWVSVRSSVIFPSNDSVSFSGIFSTELNIRGFDNLQVAIKRIYASLFTDDVVAYASRMDVDLSEVKLAVVVQKMVQAEISGVVFTVDPITQDATKLGIEAVYGLGDVISTGEITPDSYLLNKRDLSIVEKRIAPQEWMRVRTMNSRSKKGNDEKIKISPSWSHRQKLTDRDIQEVSKIALIIENKSRLSQNLEWVISGGRAWILQNKPLNTEKLSYKVRVAGIELKQKTLRDVIVAFLDKYKPQEVLNNQVVDDAKRMVMKGGPGLENRLETLITAARLKKEEALSSTQLDTKDLLVSGIGASFGIAIGKVSIVSRPTDKKYTKEDILLIKEYSTEMESMIIPCGGVIMDYGGITSDTAILCRELKIPAVVGASKASEIIKEGDWVKIDGNTGSIYKENHGEEVASSPVVDTYIENVNFLKTQQEEPEVVVEEHKLNIVKDRTLTPSATRVFSMADLEPSKLVEYVGNSHGIVYVDLDQILLKDGKHLLSYVEDRRFLDYSKKICEEVIKYAELAEGNEVVLLIGSGTAGEFMDLTKGKEFENQDVSKDIYGAAHYVANPSLLERVIKIVKRIRNVYKKRNVSIGIYSPMNEDVMKEFKKYLSAEGLRRTSSFDVFAVLDNPSEVIIAEDIINTKIDGFILDMPKIAREMQGLKTSDKNAKYDLGRNSIFKVVDSILSLTKPYGGKVIAVVEDSQPLLRHCIQSGVYGVSVFAQEIVNSRKIVSEEESRLILGK
jgi:pyruvate,water dikinase